MHHLPTGRSDQIDPWHILDRFFEIFGRTFSAFVKSKNVCFSKSPTGPVTIDPGPHRYRFRSVFVDFWAPFPPPFSDFFRKYGKPRNLAPAPCLLRFSMLFSSKNLTFSGPLSIDFSCFSRTPPGGHFWRSKVPVYTQKIDLGTISAPFRKYFRYYFRIFVESRFGESLLLILEQFRLPFWCHFGSRDGSRKGKMRCRCKRRSVHTLHRFCSFSRVRRPGWRSKTQPREHFFGLSFSVLFRGRFWHSF